MDRQACMLHNFWPRGDIKTEKMDVARERVTFTTTALETVPCYYNTYHPQHPLSFREIIFILVLLRVAPPPFPLISLTIL